MGPFLSKAKTECEIVEKVCWFKSLQNLDVGEILYKHWNSWVKYPNLGLVVL